MHIWMCYLHIFIHITFVQVCPCSFHVSDRLSRLHNWSMQKLDSLWCSKDNGKLTPFTIQVYVFKQVTKNGRLVENSSWRIQSVGYFILKENTVTVLILFPARSCLSVSTIGQHSQLVACACARYYSAMHYYLVEIRRSSNFLLYLIRNAHKTI